MALYFCRLVYLSGKSKFLLANEEEFLRYLRSRDPILVSYYELPDWLVNFKEGFSKLSIGRVKLEEFIDFAKSMSVMLRAGVPIVYALEDYAEMTTSKALQRAVNEVAEMVKAGERLSDALAASKVFPEVFHRVIKIGEETGNLDGAFKDIADHLERVLELKNNIKRALMYPSFVLVSTFGALVFWLVYVLPKIVKLFQGMNLKLPGITLIVMATSNIFKLYWYYILMFWVVLIVASIILRKKNEKFAYVLDFLFIKMPIVRLIVCNFQLAFIADYMRLLISAGANMDRTLELVAGSVSNRVFQKAMARIKEKVVLGDSLSKSFSEEVPLFPKFFIRMIKSGEESGTLDEQLKFAAQFYYEKLADITEKIGKMLEPFVLVVVGGLFAIVMISLLMPIYDLVSKIGMG